MAEREQSAAGTKSKETTPLLVNDLEIAYGTTTPVATLSEKKPPQTLWEWTKAEVACYSKYMCPVIIANSIILIIILAYFGILSKLSEDWDRINRYGPNHQSPRWKEAASSRFV